MNNFIRALLAGLLMDLIGWVLRPVWRRLRGLEDEVGADCGSNPIEPADARTRRAWRALGGAVARARFPDAPPPDGP